MALCIPNLCSGMQIVSLEYIQKYSWKVLLTKQLSMVYYTYSKGIFLSGIFFFNSNEHLLEASATVSWRISAKTSLCEEHLFTHSTNMTWSRSSFCLEEKPKPELEETSWILPFYYLSGASKFYTIFQTRLFNPSMNTCKARELIFGQL